MRDIRFRGLSIVDDKWLYGSLINNAFYQSNDGSVIPYILDTDKIEYDSFIDIGEQLTEFQVYPESVGQYAGMKDKNSVEIYEGDIYEKKGDTYLVIYRDKFLYRKIYNSWLERNVFLEDKTSWISKVHCKLFNKVIGNIHENKDLLT